MAQSEISANDTVIIEVNHDGDEIGVISGFRGGQAYVDPDPGITDQIMSTLGWNDADDDPSPV